MGKKLKKVDSITIRYVFTEDLVGVNFKSRCDSLILKEKGEKVAGSSFFLFFPFFLFSTSKFVSCFFHFLVLGINVSLRVTPQLDVSFVSLLFLC